MNPRERVLKVLLRILNNPNRYTRKQLAAHFGERVDNIKGDTEIINSLAELNVYYKDPPYTCRIEANNNYSALDVFRPLTDSLSGKKLIAS